MAVCVCVYLCLCLCVCVALREAGSIPCALIVLYRGGIRFPLKGGGWEGEVKGRDPAPLSPIVCMSVCALRIRAVGRGILLQP